MTNNYKCEKCNKFLRRHISEDTKKSHYHCYDCHTTIANIEEDKELFTEEDYDKKD